MKNNALIVFVKNPVEGKVKTRLAASIGTRNALEAYVAMLKQTERTAAVIDAHRYVYYSDFIGQDDGWSGSLFSKRLQQGGDLGERMNNALKEVLDHHSKAVLIGSDIPGLSSEIIRQAFVVLDDHDGVIGPAEDGGFYLIGLKRACPELFAEMTWSHSNVLANTCSRLNQYGLSYRMLQTLRDVDDEEDWKNLKALLPKLPSPDSSQNAPLTGNGC